MKLQIEKYLLESLLTLALVIEARDPYTGGHSWRVSQYARILAKEAGLDHGLVFASQIGGLVHDLGKIGIPDSILNKPGKLEIVEYEMMKEHPLIGGKIIEHHPLAPLAYHAIMQHHERPDGKGYPHGLPNDQYTIIGKLVSIADAFDAMTSSRSYRREMPIEKAFSILEENLNSQFDQKLGSLFVDLGRKGRLDHIIGHRSENSLMLSCVGCGPVIIPDDELKEGDEVKCPTCYGAFKVHKHGDGFELEFSHHTGYYVPSADKTVVKEILSHAPEEIIIPV